MTRFSLSIAALLLLLAAPSARADTDISVMTQNQYLGADLAPLLAAPDQAAFNAALVAVLEQIAANDLPRRAERLAATIAKRRPHLVGLQEVWAFECFDLVPVVPGFGCTDPSIAGAFNDHLSETLAALAAQGEPYQAVAVVENLDLRDVQVQGLPPGVPFEVNGVPALLVALDRDVILARNHDVIATPALLPCARPSVNGCNFQVVAEAPTPLGPLAIERGFVAVDARIDDTDYRFVTTHLEVHDLDPTNPLSNFFQAAQAAELIQTLALTTPGDRKLIVVGDINSSPEHLGVPGPLPLPEPFDQGIVTPYLQFVLSGYTDIWAVGPAAADDGFTCCQAPDLSNATSHLDERIDMIFSGELPTAVKDAEVAGDRVKDKTSPPGPALWPSDHASVQAEVTF